MKKLPNLETEFAEWYQEIIYQAELVDQSPVRGMMVIRPYGYAMWEHIKNRLDQRIKETGHQNASFPLFIPKSFITKEAEHIEGFAPELAIVTHAGGKELDEPLVVRPTSETIIHYMFARWINSWRDLPLKINQWANVVRWELRPRAFLRTTEFFWQEGHTAHQTKKEAEQEVMAMLKEYANLARDYLAIPVICGKKSESEKFPGAEKTVTFEAVMPDGKALQMGTSHLLSQNFAKAFNMSFQDQDEVTTYPHLTSWGVTTRLIGATIMVHGDQKGLVLPPRIAPIQVVIIPILLKNKDNQEVMLRARELASSLKESGIRVHLDDQEQKTPGAKYYHWELRGVPFRMELGPRDLKNNQAVIVDRLQGNKEVISLDTLVEYLQKALEEYQNSLFKRAEQKLQLLRKTGEKLEVFGPELERDGGLYQTGWCLDPVCEQGLKKYKATTRCLIDDKQAKICFGCEKESQSDVLVAKSY